MERQATLPMGMSYITKMLILSSMKDEPTILIDPEREYEDEQAKEK